MNDELREQILQLIREELSVDIETSNEYTGGFDGSPLYKNSHTLKIMLGNECISSVYLD
jgi:hypothetical protein